MIYLTYSTSMSMTFTSGLTAPNRDIRKVSGLLPRFGERGILTP